MVARLLITVPLLCPLVSAGHFFDVYVIQHEAELPAALAALQESSQRNGPFVPQAARCIAVDLEWRPSGWRQRPKPRYEVPGPTRVALMQLASADVVVLVRFSRMRFRMPQELRRFLRCSIRGA